MPVITKPAIGSTGWGQVLNDALDGLVDAATSAQATADTSADAAQTALDAANAAGADAQAASDLATTANAGLASKVSESDLDAQTAALVVAATTTRTAIDARVALGGAVNSVQGYTGAVDLTTDDIPDTSDNQYLSDTAAHKLASLRRTGWQTLTVDTVVDSGFTYDHYAVDATGGARAITLYQDVAGVTHYIQKVDASANAVTVTPSSIGGAGTINGGANVVLSKKDDWVEVQNTALNTWRVLRSNLPIYGSLATSLAAKLALANLDTETSALFGSATSTRNAVDARVALGGGVTDASVAAVVPGTLTKAAIEAIIAASSNTIINVKNYGALGNGSHDDTANINAACNAVDSAKGRTTVYVPPGTYMINGVNPAQPESNARFIDAGILPLSGTTFLMHPDAILKVIPNSSPSYGVIYMGAGKKNITIRGGQLLGDRLTHDYTTVPDYPTFEFGYGITVRGAQNITIDSVSITGMIGDCIVVGCYGNDKSLPGYIGGSAVIKNCYLQGARRNNISVIGADWCTVENNTIKDAGQDDGVKDGTLPRAGIDLEWGVQEFVGNVTIKNNRFVNNKACSIENYNGKGVVIEGNFCDNVILSGLHSDADCIIKGNVMLTEVPQIHAAINIATGYGGNIHSAITDNIIIGEWESGISLAGNGAICEGNYITGFVNYGIGAYLTNECSIIGNHIFDAKTGSTTSVGIGLNTPLATPNRISVHSNTVTNCYVGIAWVNSATGISAIGNTIKKCYQGMIVGDGLVQGNYFRLAGHAAGQSYDIIYAGSTQDVTIKGNTFKDSAAYSIFALGSSTNRSRIVDNLIKDSASTIAILTSDGSHEITGNTISVKRASGSLYGIYLGGAAINCKVIGNIGFATGASPYGVLVRSSDASGTPASVVIGNMFDGATVVQTHASDIVGENFSSTKTLASLTGAQTLTNKRVTPRVVTTTTASTLAIDSDATDLAVRTGQGAALAISAPTGTPTAGQVLSIRIKDDGTARALTWNAAFRSLSATLPTTTVINTPLIVTVRWNEVDSKWDATSAPSVGGGTGDVVGPSSAVSANVATFSGTTGKLLQDSGLSLDTDGTLAANSDTKIPSQKAIKTAVALKKTDSMSTNKLLGRGTASTGAIEEITLGTNLSLSGTTLNASGGGSPTRGQYVRSGGYIGVSGSGTMSVGATNGYYRPLYVKKGGTVTSVKINVTIASGAGGLVQVALYPHNATTGLPTVGAPTFSTLSLDTTSTGTKTATVSWTLTDDTIYWIFVGATVSSCTLSAVSGNTGDDLLGASSNATTYIAALLDWNSGGLTGPPSSPDPRIAAGQIPTFPSVVFGS